MSIGIPSAKKMLLPGIRYAMYWMISSAGEVLRSLELGSGKVRANGVCPVGSVWGLRAAGVMRLSGTNWWVAVGLLVEVPRTKLRIKPPIPEKNFVKPTIKIFIV
jgi:hypothetical protein